jgi:signal transduction histidine kinase
MSAIDPAVTPDTAGPDPRPAGTAAAGANGAAANPFLSHLQSLRELQITLSQEGRAESILNEGTTGTVEIVGADCAIAVVEPSNGQGPLRFGWIEGRQMAQHEIAVVCRRYEQALGRVRSGQVSRLVLGAGAETEPGEAEGQPAGSPKFGVTLLLGIDASIGSRGALLLARHDPLPFNREQILMADILVTLMSIQIERALRATDARRAGERLQDECAAATRSLREVTLELQAIEAVAMAATPSLDLHRQIEIALSKTLEMTRFKVGAVFLVEETNGEETLRFARGDGDRAYLDLARGRSHRRGEGIAGRVWESGESLTCADISSAPPAQGTEEIVALRRAGYRSLICVPLRARGRVLGTMELLSSDARPELESRPALAQAIAGQIAIVIQNARLLSDVMRHCLELETLQQTQESDLERWRTGLSGLRNLLDGAARQNDLRQTLDGALGKVLERFGHPAGTVHLVDPGTRALHLRATRGLSPGTLEQLGFRVSRTMIGKALESGAPVFEPDEQSERLDPDGMMLRAAVPLRAASGVHGVLAVASPERRVLQETETDALSVVGAVLGLLVENSRAFQSAPPLQPPSPELTAQLVQAQKMESIGTLAGGIAHEFNNILTAILGYASHIRSLTTGDNPIHRQATTIEEQSRRAAELTQQLLAFAHGGQYTLEPLDLNQAIAETVSFLSKGLDPRLTIETRLAPDLPEIEGDKGQIRQVLVSLAVNAAEAMPEGGRITFESRLAHLGRQYAVSRPDLVPGDYVEVVIGDTGVGMTPEMADRVFEPFFTTKTSAKSTGLGLSVVYGIVRNHKGHVTLSSAPDLGTTLRVYLPVLDRSRRATGDAALPAVPRSPAPPPGRAPVVPAPFERVSIVEVERRRPKGPRAALPPAQLETPPAAVKSAPPVEAPTPKDPKKSATPDAAPDRKRRILVIDDEESVRDMARELLESHGFEVVLAVDGVDALDVYRREWGRIDVVLLDMVMPRMGGFETYRRLVGMDRSAKVLLCSGYADSDKAQKVLKEGALGLLQKPFTIMELVGWIERVLGRK